MYDNENSPENSAENSAENSEDVFTDSDNLIFSSMDIENLRATYKTLMIQYEKAINDINSPEKNKNDVIVCSTTKNKIVRKNINDNFKLLNTDLQIFSVSSNYDGTITICTKETKETNEYKLYIQNQYSSNIIVLPKVCCINTTITKALLAPDNSMIGIGNDNNMYAKIYANGSSQWAGPINDPGEKFLDVALCPNNSLLCIGTDNGLYTYSSYKILKTNRSKTNFSTSNFKPIAITVSQEGVVYAIDTNNMIQKTKSYTLLNDIWESITDPNNFKFTSIALYSDVYKAYGIKNLEYLNKNLLKINLQIQKLMEDEKNQIYDDGYQTQEDSNKNLVELYDKLLEDKARIKLSLDEYKTLEEKQNSSMLYVKKYNVIIKFVLLIFFILFLLIIIMYFTSGFNRGYNPGYNPRYNQGYNPRYNQGYNQGYNPRYNQGYY
jgi:hypothetical protein